MVDFIVGVIVGFILCAVIGSDSDTNIPHMA